jgi:hypothetical protein
MNESASCGLHSDVDVLRHAYTWSSVPNCSFGLQCMTVIQAMLLSKCYCTCGELTLIKLLVWTNFTM